MKKRIFTYIDLFCGCGGFSLGMERAGFKNLAAIDFNKEAIEVYRKNFPYVKNVLLKDLTQFPPELLAPLLSKNHVDVIVGGPPCQGFSHIGKKNIKDPRNGLFVDFEDFFCF